MVFSILFVSQSDSSTTQFVLPVCVNGWRWRFCVPGTKVKVPKNSAIIMELVTIGGVVCGFGWLNTAAWRLTMAGVGWNIRLAIDRCPTIGSSVDRQDLPCVRRNFLQTPRISTAHLPSRCPLPSRSNKTIRFRRRSRDRVGARIAQRCYGSRKPPHPRPVLSAQLLTRVGKKCTTPFSQLCCRYGTEQHRCLGPNITFGFGA